MKRITIQKYLEKPDAESYEAMHRQQSDLFYAEFRPNPVSARRNPNLRKFARRMSDELAAGSLASIGITAPATRRRDKQ